MPSVLLVETEELITPAAASRARLHAIPTSVSGLAPGVAALLAIALAVVAPFLAVFASTTTTRAGGSSAPVGAPVRFVFDGWGRPMTAHSADAIGFPFAGHGPSFGLATVACAALLVLAVIRPRRSARSGVPGRTPTAPWLGLAGGAALLALAAAMALTVQPGVDHQELMTRTTSLGPCVWLTAVAGVVAIAGEMIGAAGARHTPSPGS